MLLAVFLPLALIRGFLFFLLILTVLYFLPSIIAIVRGHPQVGPILVINFLLGWTLIAWVLVLAWSVSAIHLRD